MKRESMLIEAEELLDKIDDKNIRIFDATITEDAYRQEHIPGGAFFDHERFSVPDSRYACTLLPVDRLAGQMGAAGISNDTEVIVYACDLLPYAARAWWLLRYAGHNHVRLLNGGLSAWKQAGGQVEQTARRYAPAVFRASPRPDMFASKEDVLAALEQADTAVLDVLPPASYAGAHITGSANLSCMDLMQGMDYFLPDDRLAARLQETSKYKRIITYCGGGIAAAVSAMAHVLVGQEGAAVYDGSLDEWIGEGLPLTETGKWQIWETPS